jgi:hypothetical protein
MVRYLRVIDWLNNGPAQGTFHRKDAKSAKEADTSPQRPLTVRWMP